MRGSNSGRVADDGQFDIDTSGLSKHAQAQATADFILAASSALRLLTDELDRMPTERKADMIRTALAAHFNKVRIPRLRTAGALH